MSVCMGSREFSLRAGSSLFGCGSSLKWGWESSFRAAGVRLCVVGVRLPSRKRAAMKLLAERVLP